MQKAHTIIEAIFYSVLLTVFLLVAMTFAIQILGAASLSGSIEEFQTNQELILQKISDSIYGATSVDVDNSVFDSEEGVLSLIMPESSDSPTKIYFEANGLYFKEGTADPVQLNTYDIKIDYLTFHRVVSDKAPDQIIVDMQFSPVSTDLAHLQHTLPLHLTISLRSS